MQVFIFGAGYSGKAFANARADEAIQIAGTTRSREKFPALAAAGIEPFAFDGGALSDDVLGVLSETTDLVISIAPEGGDNLAESTDPVLALARDAIIKNMPRLRWIGYLSTVGVYGDHQGAWIGETAECRPKSGRSQRRGAAEQEWLELGRETGLPVAILRLSGIYGPGRNALVNLRDGTAKRLIKKDQVFNRIHVDDIAGALWHLAGRGLGGVFNITDNLPAPPQDVVTYAAALMGVEPPPEMPFDTAELSPMARSFYGENKRVSNAAIRATGYSFRHPTYQAALNAMWADGSWSGDKTGVRSPIRRT
jgi:nucleoside-diphosphate-sugar epimerase